MSTSPEVTRQQRARNLLFMSDPKRWVVWPFLPLIRPAPDGDQPCDVLCGVLCDMLGLHGMAGYRATVFLTNLFTLPVTLDDFLALPRETFDTPEEMFDAGWRVD